MAENTVQYQTVDDDPELLQWIHEFWDKSSKGCGLYTYLQLRGNNPLEDEIRQAIPDNRRMRILDAGTGAGHVAITLALMGHDVVGIDICEGMLSEARWNTEKLGVKIELRKEDANSTSFDDSSFDMIVARNLLFTLADPGKAYTEWIRLLRPGGWILVMDGNYYFQTKMEAYARREEFMRYKHGMEELAFSKEMGNVDYSELRSFATRLYPNRVRRPSWDVWFLMYSYMDSITVRCNDKEDFSTLDEYGTRRIPLRYVLTARKPFISTPSSPMLNAPDLASTLPALNALDNPIRLKMLQLIMEGERTNKDLSTALDLKENLTSYHLNLLRDAGLIVPDKKGRTVKYKITDYEAVVSMFRMIGFISRRDDPMDEDFQDDVTEQRSQRICDVISWLTDRFRTGALSINLPMAPHRSCAVRSPPS